MRDYEVGIMNKWIPISLFVFFGIYLLTTARAAVVAYPDITLATSLPELQDQLDPNRTR
jgi:hypothetical protein